jgi:O-antigen ligase
MRTMLAGFEIASWGVVVLSPFVIYITLKHGGVQGEHVPFIFQKSGDLAVHLAGAGSFRLIGLNQRASQRPSGLRRLADLTFWSCWVICAAWSASASRSGLLTMVVSMAIIFAMGYGRRIILLAGTAVLAAGIILGALQIGVRYHGPREISMDQLLANSLSIVGDTRADLDSGIDIRSLQANTNWRLNWWRHIVNDTVSTDHFWTGRGFGLNLATADGFQVDARESLRSPHSIQMTILARVGVPGLAAWLLFLTAMAAALVLQARRMRLLGFLGWHALNVWVLTYWIATIVNGSFDVYLEGPQGGIWSWCLVGLGIAAVELEKRARLAPERVSVPV